MKKLGMGLLFFSLIFATVHCDRSTEKSEVEDSSIDKYLQLNEMEKEILGKGETLDNSTESFEEEVEMVDENFPDLE